MLLQNFSVKGLVDNTAFHTPVQK